MHSLAVHLMWTVDEQAFQMDSVEHIEYFQHAKVSRTQDADGHGHTLSVHTGGERVQALESDVFLRR